MRTKSIYAILLLSVACSGRAGSVVAKAVVPEGVAAAAGNSPAITLDAANPMRRFIKIETVRPKDTSGVATITGRIGFDEDRTSRVGSAVSGRIESLMVKPGDHVTKGQPLLTIMSPEVEAALADQRSADADATLALRNLERAKSLFELAAVAKKEVAAAESEVVRTQAARDSALAKLRLLGLSPSEHTSRYTLRAPIAGTVVDRAALPGSEVRADSGTPLVTLSNLDHVWILADAYERDLSLVQAGQEAAVEVASYPGESFVARVDHVGDVVDPQSHTVKVRLSADNPGDRLKPDMFARVSLRLAAAGGIITVPSQAVVSDGEANLVIVCIDNSRFEKRPVVAIAEAGNEVRITSGLKEGERIVTEGALFVRSEIDNR